MKLTTLEQTIENINFYNTRTNNYERGWKLLRKYQKRLTEDVKLWMFLPCTSLGELLEKPKYNADHDEILFQTNFKRYEEAQARVLFKDVVSIEVRGKKVTKYHTINNKLVVITNEDGEFIEKMNFQDLLDWCESEIELTESGQKYFEV